MFIPAYDRAIIVYEGWHGLDLICTCLQGYLDKPRQGHLKVIFNGLTNVKNSNFVYFFQFDLEMTLRLSWHDLEEIPIYKTIPDHVIICD